MEQDIKIRKLDPTEKESIIKIAQWYFEEWNTPIDKTVNRLTNQPSKGTIFQLVLTIDNNVIATGGLCNIVNIFKVHERLKKYRPWLGLLYTQKEYRNKGFGTMLLNQIERFAKEKDFTKIYLYTFTAESLYRSCGWTELERVIYKDHDTIIMGKTL